MYNVSHKNQKAAEKQEFLAFTLGSEEYCIDILKVQEIRGYEPVTPLPNTPAFMKGVVNLRGLIVPIIDLRIKLDLYKVEYDQFTVVIILGIRGRIIGVVVDSVSDVVALEADEIKPAPQMGAAIKTDYINGLASVDERMLIIIDIEKLATIEELIQVEKVLEPA
ncbi:MAG: chemotaxis protein CheW [Pseudomonadota bacterium]|nr:chemotaxis protein CheW [Pseudomonadota bacterium]